MYLSVTLKLHLATFSRWERSFSASVALHSLHFLSCIKHSFSVLRSSKLVILCIEALTWLALQKSSNTWKSVFYIANNIKFHEKEHLSFTWALLLKLHLATFSHWERSFSASVALDSLHLLSCTKHSISVLRSSKPVILCIEALTWLALQKSSNTSKSVFYIANNISFHEKETSFMYLSFNLKIAFSNFLSLRSSSASVALHSLHLLSCTKHSIKFLEALN